MAKAIAILKIVIAVGRFIEYAVDRDPNTKPDFEALTETIREALKAFAGRS